MHSTMLNLAFEFEHKDGNAHCTSSTNSQSRHSSVPLLLGRRGGGAKAEARREDRTGTEFPAEFCHISKSECPILVGVGSRRKRLLGLKNIDVYALGFYVDGRAAQKTLGTRFPGADVKTLASSQKLCDEVVAAQDLEKTVRIVITSGLVDHGKFVGALKESLAPSCEKEGDKESLPEFERLFEGAEFKKGLELAFTNTKSGGLAAKIGNRDVGEVKSAAFTRAFFNLYLGSNPVSQEGKTSISQGLAKIAVSPASSTGTAEPSEHKEAGG